MADPEKRMTVVRHYASTGDEANPVYKLLDKGFPLIRTPTSDLDLYALARHLDMTTQALYSLLKAEKVSEAFAFRAVVAASGALKCEDFVPLLRERQKPGPKPGMKAPAAVGEPNAALT